VKSGSAAFNIGTAGHLGRGEGAAGIFLRQSVILLRDKNILSVKMQK
jgi:hypothetical protein